MRKQTNLQHHFITQKKVLISSSRAVFTHFRECVGDRSNICRHHFVGVFFTLFLLNLYLLSELSDNRCYPAGGGLLRQRSDTQWGDGPDEGEAAFHK